MGRGGDLEASVRKYLPKDEQIVVAILGCYAGVFGLVKLKGAMSAKPPVPAAPVAVAAAATSVGRWGFTPPTIDTFDEWEKNEDNWTKWETFMSGPLLDQWCNELK